MMRLLIVALLLSGCAAKQPSPQQPICFVTWYGDVKCITGPARCGSDTECEALGEE